MGGVLSLGLIAGTALKGSNVWSSDILFTIYCGFYLILTTILIYLVDIDPVIILKQELCFYDLQNGNYFILSIL